nr:TolC family protein [Pseudomonas sp. B329]
MRFSLPTKPVLDLSVGHLVVEDAKVDPGNARLDLWQAVTLAVEVYPSIRDAAARVDQQREAINVAKAGYLPTVQVGLSTGKQGIYGNGQSLSLNASQMLYDFGKVANSVKDAEAGVRVQQLQMMAATDEVARQSAQTLIEVSRYNELLDVANGQSEGVKRLRELARQRARDGASTQADLIQAQSRVEAAQSALLAIQTQLQQQRTKLHIMIGRDLTGTDVSVPAERLLQSVLGIEPTPEHPVAVRLAEAQLDEAQVQFSLAKSNTMPTFTADGGVSKYMGSAGDQVYTLTVGVKHDLFAGGAPSARVRGAGLGVRAAEERIYTRKLESNDEWTALRQQMSGLKDRLKVLVERQKNIYDTQQLYREQYLSLGTRTLLDLLNTEQEIFQARSDLVNVRHDLWVAQVGFINATGYMHDVFQIKEEL